MELLGWLNAASPPPPPEMKLFLLGVQYDNSSFVAVAAQNEVGWTLCWECSASYSFLEGRWGLLQVCLCY